MLYAYEHAVPFKYKKYTELKSVTFTDEIKTHLDDFYQYIDSICEDEYKDSKGKVDKDKLRTLIVELASKYKELRNQYIKPVVEKEYKYKELLYTQEEVDFIFACSYPLLDKFNMSQSMLCEIFFGKQRERKFNPDTGKEEWKRTKENKFSKLGCFPVRCHDAYTKLDDVSARKCLISNDSNSIGIQIAECINKEVQAVYACSAFVGVSNDLDLFANISTTDKKKYITTISSVSCGNDSAKVQQVIGYGRYLFATANNIKNAKGESINNEIKTAILKHLGMSDDKVLYESERLKDFLREGSEYVKYVRGDKDSFDELLFEYRVYFNAFSEMQEYGELPDRDLNDDYGEYLDESELQIEYIEDNFDEIYNWIEQKKLEIENTLIKRMSYAVVKNFDVDDFSDYVLCLFNRLIKKIEISVEQSTIIIDELSVDEKIQCIAIYWMCEMLWRGTINQDSPEQVKQYLKTKKLLTYFDAMNKEIGKGKKLHVVLEPDSFDILKTVDELCERKTDDNIPVMLYIDVKAYPNITDNMDKLINRSNLILIIRDADGITSKYNMRPLNKKLNLYYTEG